MEAIIFALLASSSWGAADFLGGINTRNISLFSVLFISHLTGFISASLLIRFHPVSIPIDFDFLIYSIFAGAVSLVAIGSLYKAMSIGPISIVISIASSGSILPVSFGILNGESLNIFQIIGIIAAIIGVIVVSIDKNENDNQKHLVAGASLAFTAALAVGGWMILMDKASGIDPYWTTFVNRTSALILLLLMCGFKKKKIFNLNKTRYISIGLVGVLETCADCLFAIASTKGFVSVVSVVSSLYPILTILLARAVLNERLSKLQEFGVVFAFAGLVLISM